MGENMKGIQSAIDTRHGNSYTTIKKEVQICISMPCYDYQSLTRSLCCGIETHDSVIDLTFEIQQLTHTHSLTFEFNEPFYAGHAEAVIARGSNGIKHDVEANKTRQHVLNRVCARKLRDHSRCSSWHGL